MVDIDVSTLRDDSVRAAFLADHVGDPDGAIDVLAQAIERYVSDNGVDKLPEDLCGPVMATLGAAMVGSLIARFDGPDGTWNGDPMELIVKSQVCANTIDHAATDHGDSLGQAMRNTETIAQTYDAIVEWVASRLWADADLDPALVDLDSFYGDDSDAA